MVVGVVPHIGVGFGAAAGDDVPRTAMVTARGFYRVLAVVVLRLLGEDAFIIAKMGIVIVGVVIRAAGENIVCGFFGLAGKRRNCSGLIRRRCILITAEVEAEVTSACDDGESTKGHWKRFLRRFGLGHAPYCCRNYLENINVHRVKTDIQNCPVPGVGIPGERPPHMWVKHGDSVYLLTGAVQCDHPGFGS